MELPFHVIAHPVSSSTWYLNYLLTIISALENVISLSAFSPGSLSFASQPNSFQYCFPKEVSAPTSPDKLSPALADGTSPSGSSLLPAPGAPWRLWLPLAPLTAHGRLVLGCTPLNVSEWVSFPWARLQLGQEGLIKQVAES